MPWGGKREGGVGGVAPGGTPGGIGLRNKIEVSKKKLTMIFRESGNDLYTSMFSPLPSTHPGRPGV